MIVYSLCKNDEYMKIITECSLSNIGKLMQTSNKNTYNYLPKTKYLHFFKNYFDMFHLKGCINKDMYITFYDIPYIILNNNISTGLYYNYFSDLTITKINEYAIPVDDLNYNYLVRIDKILEKIEIEELLDNDFKNKIITIYSKKYIDDQEIYKINKDFELDNDYIDVLIHKK